jgi:hypothetical protein
MTMRGLYREINLVDEGAIQTAVLFEYGAVFQVVSKSGHQTGEYLQL